MIIIPLAEATACDAEHIGPKAANLAALGRAGLPTPGGFCLSADAYEAQIAALGLTSLIRRFAAAWSSSLYPQASFADGHFLAISRVVVPALTA